jgi:hypothetical protein
MLWSPAEARGRLIGGASAVHTCPGYDDTAPLLLACAHGAEPGEDGVGRGLTVWGVLHPEPAKSESAGGIRTRRPVLDSFWRSPTSSGIVLCLFSRKGHADRAVNRRLFPAATTVFSTGPEAWAGALESLTPVRPCRITSQVNTSRARSPDNTRTEYSVTSLGMQLRRQKLCLDEGDQSASLIMPTGAL